MRNFGKFILFLLICTLLGTAANATMPPDESPNDPSPNTQANLNGAPSELAILTSALKEAVIMRESLDSVTNVTRTRQIYDKYKANMGQTILNWFSKKFLKKRSKIITYSRTIEDCKKLKVANEYGIEELVKADNEHNVQKAFKKLFFQYPSKKNQTKYAYAQQGEQLKMDTTLEMFIIAKEMQKELAGDEIKLFGEPLVIPDDDNEAKNKEIEKKLDGVPIEKLSMVNQLKLYEKCLVGNQFCDYIKVTSCNGNDDTGDDTGKEADMLGYKDGGSVTEEHKNEDMVCFWNSAIKAENLYDTVMRNNEFLVAMLAQYRAVIGISTLAKIREYEEESKSKEEKSSALDLPYLNHKTYKVSRKLTADTMFADMSTEEIEAEKEIQKYENILKDPADFSGGDFELSNGASGYEHLLDLRRSNFIGMEKIAEAQASLQRAEQMHNVLRMLPDYLEIYKAHDHAKKVHDISRKMTLRSGECAMQMLSPYYKKPYQVWFGPAECTTEYDGDEPSGNVICHYADAKAFDDTSESVGLFDTPCPDDSAQKCYLMKIDDYVDMLNEEDIDDDGATEKKTPTRPNAIETSAKGGLVQYLLDLYRAAIDGNALYEYDVDAVITVTSDAAEAGDYTSHVEIKSDKESTDLSGKTRAAKYVNIYKDETAQTDENNSANPAEEGEEEAEEDSSAVYITERDNINDMSDILTGVESAKDLDEDDAKEAASETKNEEAQSDLKKDTQIEGLLRWVIGSEVMKDVARDLDFGLNKEGTAHFCLEPHCRKRKFQLWQDQMAFYDQYIDGKYENIKEYIRTVPTSLLLRNIASNLLNALPDGDVFLQEFFAKEEQEITEMITENDGVFDVIREEYINKVKTMLQKRQAAIAQKDETADKLSKANATYNRAKRAIEEGELQRNSSVYGEEYEKEFYEKAERDDYNADESPQNKSFKEEEAKAQEKIKTAEEEMAAAASRAAGYERTIEDLKKQIEKIDEKLDKAHRQYVKDMSDAENEEMDNNKRLANKLRKARKMFTEPEDVIANILPVLIFDNILDCARNYAVSRVEEAQKKIKDLKEAKTIYMPGSYDDLQQIHAQMIDEITQITPANIAQCGTMPDLSLLGADKNGKKLLGLNMFAGICNENADIPDYIEEYYPDLKDEDKKNFCKRPDNEFFVGAIGLPHDFAAPRSPDWFTSAPLREVFYFDIHDFSAISKYYKGDEDDIERNTDLFVSQRLLLEELLGGSSTPTLNKIASAEMNTVESYIDGTDSEKQSAIPEVWKWILRPHAFVQRSFDLRKLIGVQDGDDEERKLARLSRQEIRRSGLHPCRSLEYDLDGNPTGRVYVDKDGVPTNIPVQYVIDVNDDLAYSALSPFAPVNSGAMLIEQMGQHPDWPNYTTVPYVADETTPAESLKGLPECQALQVRVKLKGNTLIKAHVYDFEADALMQNKNFDWEEPLVSETGNTIYYSELGNFLTYFTSKVEKVIDKNKCEIAKKTCPPGIVYNTCISGPCATKVYDVYRLTYNNQIVNSLTKYSEDYGKEGHEIETSLQNLAQRVMPQKNQLGDFLSRIETMRITANNLLESEKNIKQTQLELEEILKDTGFVFGEGFDLVRSSDYNNLRNKLIEEKNKAIDEALNAIKDLKVTTAVRNDDGEINEEADGEPIDSLLTQKTDIMRRALLYQMDSADNECIADYPGDLVIINGDEDIGNGDICSNEMVEKMKNAKADWDIAQATAEEVSQQREKMLKRFDRPYCAVYHQ